MSFSGEEDNTLLYCIYVGIIVANVLHIYLSLKQLKVLHTNTEVPEEFKDELTKEDLESIRLYRIEAEDFNMCCAIFRVLLAYIELHFEVVKNVWTFLSCETKKTFRCCECGGKRCTYQELIITALFTFVFVAYHSVKTLFSETFEEYILDRHYRHKRICYREFIKKQCYQSAELLAKGMTLSLGIVWINQIDECMHYFLYVWLFVSSMATVCSLPLCRQADDLMKKQTPVPESVLKTKIKTIADKAELILEDIYMTESSNNPRHKNTVSIVGFTKTKKLVLDKRLLEGSPKYSEAEVLSFVAHEIGHWYHTHWLCDYLLTVSQLLLLVNIYVYWYDDAMLYSVFGFEFRHFPIIVGIYIVYFYILIPYNMFMNMFTLYIRRRYEYEADRYACELVSKNDMIHLLKRNCKDNMEFPMADCCYTMVFLGEPPIDKRIAAIQQLKTQE